MYFESIILSKQLFFLKLFSIFSFKTVLINFATGKAKPFFLICFALLRRPFLLKKFLKKIFEYFALYFFYFLHCSLD